ncbi:MAG TPA: glycosyl hydrolase [Bacteroidales bacterium]|nr:glycosyl hydrolase [Bacteroidales bacterium]
MKLKRITTPVLILSALILLTGIINPVQAQRRKRNTDPASDEFTINSSMLSALKFRLIGPAAYSGRIADFAVNPEDPSEYYVGVASGGLWKTENKGTTFTPVFDKQPVFSIGALAIDPVNPNVVWVGTGENNSQRNLAYGDGVYKTTDGGKSFINVGLKESEHIGKIMIDPRNTNTVYVASQGPAWGPGGDRGLYKTTDGGKTWEQILFVGEYTGISDMEMDPRNPDILYASAHQRERRVYSKINGGPESAIYKSVDAGKTWNKLKKGLPNGDVGRIGLAVSPANPDIIYAMIELPGNKGGFYRSDDMGESWVKMSNEIAGSPQYYVEIYTDPVDPDRIISMDVRNMVSNDGGKTWEPLGEKNKHVDNHALWIDPDNTNYYLMGCDGGIYESWDKGQNSVFKSNFPVTQYYHVRTDNALPFYNVYGGAQDNGSWYGPNRTTRRYLVNADFTYTIGGDGYLSIPDPDNPGIHYAESQYCGLRRYDNYTQNSISIKPQPVEDEVYRFNWNTPYFISPHNSKTLYVAANKLFKSTDHGGLWKEISPDLTRQLDVDLLPMMGEKWPPEAIAKSMSTSPFGNIFALAESPVQQGMIYAGTDDGLIWRTDDDGDNWIKFQSFPDVPDMTFVNYILPSQHDANTVYACFDGRKNASDFTPYIIKSTDKGQTWTSIASNLPDGTIYVIQEDHINPGILFIGTEWGVWITLDQGGKWFKLNNGLPTIQVKDLDIQERENDLAVATFGRGWYILDDYSYIRQLNKEVMDEEAHIFDIEDALLYYPGSNHSGQGEVHFRIPNPKPEAKIIYFVKEGYETLKQKRMKAQREAEKQGKEISYPGDEELLAEAQEEKAMLIFTFTNSNGEIMRKIENPLRKGIGTVTWDLKYMEQRGPSVLPGQYYVSMEKYVKGKYHDLGVKKEFNINALEISALGKPDYKAKFEFLKKASDLSSRVNKIYSYTSELKEKMEKLRSELLRTPANTNDLMILTKDIEKKLDDIILSISGRRSGNVRVNATEPSIMNRMWFAAGATSGSDNDITNAQKDQYEIASTKFKYQYGKLKEIYTIEFEKLKSELLDLDIDWVPPIIPVIK